MAIVLSTDDLLSAAGSVLSRKDAQRLSNAVIVAVGRLAEALAAAEGVTLRDTSYQPDAAGLCATFRAGQDGRTSGTLGDLDPGGEW